MLLANGSNCICWVLGDTPAEQLNALAENEKYEYVIKTVKALSEWNIRGSAEWYTATESIAKLIAELAKDGAICCI
jgi:hypothetical protein